MELNVKLTTDESGTKKTMRDLRQYSIYVKIISFILIIAFLNLTEGCMMNYFKVTRATGPVHENIDNLTRQGKKIIIHMEDQAWILTSASISDTTLTGFASEKYISGYLKPINPKGANRYKTRTTYDESYLLNEVHIFTTEFTMLQNSQVTVPLSGITKIELYEKDKGATTASYILGGIGIATGVLVVVSIIVLLTKDSCPFIYTWDGENYNLTGEIYSGSIQPNLERHDYLKLPVYNINNLQYQLKISNEAKEIQHTNLLELLVFDHDFNTHVWVDKYGEYHTVTGLTAPSRAENLAGRDVSDLIASHDSLFYCSSETIGNLPLTDGLVLEFPNPKSSDKAKLIVKAKNSFLSDYMVGQFHDLFGDAYDKWTKKQRETSGEQLRQWSLDQNIPLSLSVERNGTWESLDYYNIAGPIAMKEDILQFPLNGTESDPLRIKLEAGNYFWEIDYAGIDYSPDYKIDYKVIPAISAIDQSNKDVKRLLLGDDGKYLDQPEIGNQTIVKYDLPQLTDENRTIILHSKGWYQIIRNPKGTPDREYLETFRQPGRFNRFVNEYVQALAQKAGIGNDNTNGTKQVSGEK